VVWHLNFQAVMAVPEGYGLLAECDFIQIPQKGVSELMLWVSGW
jgi:hypothetical protein